MSSYYGPHELCAEFIREMHSGDLTPYDVSIIHYAWSPYAEQIKATFAMWDVEDIVWRQFRNTAFDYLPEVKLDTDRMGSSVFATAIVDHLVPPKISTPGAPPGVHDPETTTGTGVTWLPPATQADPLIRGAQSDGAMLDAIAVPSNIERPSPLDRTPEQIREKAYDWYRQNMAVPLPTPGLYQHYKGGIYIVAGIGESSEEKNEPGYSPNLMVFYYSLEKQKWWFRPVASWRTLVVVDGIHRPRFVRIE